MIFREIISCFSLLVNSLLIQYLHIHTQPRRPFPYLSAFCRSDGFIRPEMNRQRAAMLKPGQIAVLTTLHLSVKSIRWTECPSFEGIQRKTPPL
jgi:hypothetical protein